MQLEGLGFVETLPKFEIILQKTDFEIFNYKLL